MKRLNTQAAELGHDLLILPKLRVKQWRIQDFPWGGGGGALSRWGGGHRPPTQVLFGENMQKLKNWILLGGAGDAPSWIRQC